MSDGMTLLTTDSGFGLISSDAASIFQDHLQPQTASMDTNTYLSNAEISAFDDLYQQYQENPDSVDPTWRKFFEGFEFSRTSYTGKSSIGESTKTVAPKPAAPIQVVAEAAPAQFQKEINVLNLIGAYRQRGHLFASTNPVRPRRKYDAPIELSSFDLGEADMDTVFQAGMRMSLGPTTLRQIVDHLRQTYCGSIGVEYKFVRSRDALEWLEGRMEECRNTPNLTPDQRLQMLRKINEAVAFENFLQTKFVGQKRFSLEGSESIIPALDTIVERGAELGVQEFVIGMAHRGRLNVLANILGKTYRDIFTEFEGKVFGLDGFAGDVKYHLGFSSDKEARNGRRVHLSLTPNPSHLEAVNPVVEGISRAKIEHRYEGNSSQLVPILIHGDASIAGQGIIYEVLQMSQLRGYGTGGTVHLVINNQVGFTTDYIDGRSSTYCTDVAKTTLSPVFHVNADDIEAVVYVTQLALEFRQQFKRDVFVDILGYRRHGHNEADEPRFTQPTLYKAIANHPNPLEVYSKEVIESGRLQATQVKEVEVEFKQFLNDRFQESLQQTNANVTSFLEGEWSGIRLALPEDFDESPETGVTRETLHRLTDRICDLPEELAFFPKIRKLYADRHKMIYDNDRIDWGMAETLAYATMLDEGKPVRLSGQDVARGTFSHRHSVIVAEDDTKYTPLNNLSKEQAPFSVYNSLLSEYGVLGFEFGYAFATSFGLTIWEAQFGDFANGAQIIIDQFICCAETKWQRMNGLTLLLPHGFEGQGSEHSSARIERFLELCADYNIQVVNCTTPANLFHALRRQLDREFRKPLIIFTPKSLLRHPKCVSSLSEFEEGNTFQEVIDDTVDDPTAVTKVLLCSGKIFYELAARKQEETHNDVAVVRVEQLYPLPELALNKLKERYSSVERWIWVQEEPENMGSLAYLKRKSKHIPFPLHMIARRESSSPATGFAKLHKIEQKGLIDKAFGP